MQLYTAQYLSNIRTEYMGHSCYSQNLSHRHFIADVKHMPRMHPNTLYCTDTAQFWCWWICHQWAHRNICICQMQLMSEYTRCQSDQPTDRNVPVNWHTIQCWMKQHMLVQQNSTVDSKTYRALDLCLSFKLISDSVFKDNWLNKHRFNSNILELDMKRRQHDELSRPTTILKGQSRLVQSFFGARISRPKSLRLPKGPLMSSCKHLRWRHNSKAA